MIDKFNISIFLFLVFLMIGIYIYFHPYADHVDKKEKIEVRWKDIMEIEGCQLYQLTFSNSDKTLFLTQGESCGSMVTM